MSLSENFKNNKETRSQKTPHSIDTEIGEPILAGGKIHRSNDEVDLLLSLSIAISSVNDKAGLLNMISNELGAFFKGHTVLITIINPERPANYLMFGQNKADFSHPAQTPATDISGVSFPMEYAALINDLSDPAFQKGEPVLLNVKRGVNNDDLLDFLKVVDQTNATEMFISGLGSEAQRLGALMILTNGENQPGGQLARLIKLISLQLTVVVRNILVNEKILRQEREENVLLSFSNDIATIRDKNGLDTAIRNILLKLSGTEEYILTIKDEERNCRNIYLYKLLSPLVNSNKFQVITESPLAFSDKIAEVVFKSNGPVQFNLDEEVSHGRFGLAEAVLFKSMDIAAMAGMALRVGAREIGILWMRSENLNNRQMIGIASQIATAMANIRANEKIERQLQEITDFRQQLEVEKLYLQEEIETTHNYSELIGSGKGMNNIFQMISKVAETSSSVLILGETGTGKELIARAIHNTSPRRNKMMVKINCAALPPNLIESELFGHERGSFTGATEKRIGKFELANNSTLFLDEIGELPIDLQVKLLRALQEKEIKRVGGKTVIKIDVRIIAATNRDLKNEVKLGNFRSDLYFRLNVFPVFLPPLRDRKEDINLLATHFLNKHAKKVGRKVIGFSSKVMKQLNAYEWPGNVRELEHLIERSILLTTQPVINKIHLPNAENTETDGHLILNRIKTIDDVEREHILYVLKKCKGKVSGIGGAAEALNIPSTTLGSKMKRLGITKEYSSE